MRLSLKLDPSNVRPRLELIRDLAVDGFASDSPWQIPAALLPRERTPVSLIATTGEHLPAWVQRCQDQVLTLVAVVPLGGVEESGQEDLSFLAVEFGVGGGRARLGGRFECADPAAPEVLILHEPRVLEVVQERAFPRAPVSLPIGLTVGAGGARSRAYTVDLGGRGCLLEGAAWRRVGDAIRFELRLSALEPVVRGTGRVVRVDARGRRAIAFDAIDAGRWQHLTDFVADRLPHGRPASRRTPYPLPLR
jgi:hypothetical protein